MSQIPQLNSDREVVEWYVYESSDGEALREALGHSEDKMIQICREFLQLLRRLGDEEDYRGKFAQTASRLEELSETLAPYESLEVDALDEGSRGEVEKLSLARARQRLFLSILYYLGKMKFDIDLSRREIEDLEPAIEEIIDSDEPPGEEELEVLLEWADDRIDNNRARHLLEEREGGDLLRQFRSEVLLAIELNFAPEDMLQAFHELIANILLCDLVRQSYVSGKEEMERKYVFPFEEEEEEEEEKKYHSLADSFTDLLYTLEKEYDLVDLFYIKHYFFSLAQVIHQLYLDKKYHINTQGVIIQIAQRFQSELSEIKGTEEIGKNSPANEKVQE